MPYGLLGVKNMVIFLISLKIASLITLGIQSAESVQKTTGPTTIQSGLMRVYMQLQGDGKLAQNNNPQK